MIKCGVLDEAGTFTCEAEAGTDHAMHYATGLVDNQPTWPTWPNRDCLNAAQRGEERERIRAQRTSARDTAKAAAASVSPAQARARRDRGMAAVDEHADDAWKDAAKALIASLPVGTEFMIETLRETLQANGWVAHDWRALGPIVMRAAKQGVLERVDYGKARTSNLSIKPIWRRI